MAMATISDGGLHMEAKEKKKEKKHIRGWASNPEQDLHLYMPSTCTNQFAIQ